MTRNLKQRTRASHFDFQHCFLSDAGRYRLERRIIHCDVIWQSRGCNAAAQCCARRRPRVSGDPGHRSCILVRKQINQRCHYVERLFQSRERLADPGLEQRRPDHHQRQLGGVPSIQGFLGDITPDGDRHRSPDTHRRLGRHSTSSPTRRPQHNHQWRRRGVRQHRGPDRRAAGLGHRPMRRTSSSISTPPAARMCACSSTRATSTGSADNAVQQLDVQYRIGESGTWTNIPAATSRTSTTAGGDAGDRRRRHAACRGGTIRRSSQIRIMTTNAVGSDEWVGIDDIVVSSTALGRPGTVSISDAYDHRRRRRHAAPDLHGHAHRREHRRLHRQLQTVERRGDRGDNDRRQPAPPAR